MKAKKAKNKTKSDKLQQSDGDFSSKIKAKIMTA